MLKTFFKNNLHRLIILTAGCFLSACESLPPESKAQPARLVKADDASLYIVKTAIETAMKRKNIVFGATNWDATSVISVLPVKSFSPNGAPFNQQVFEVPTLFELMIRGENCYLMQKDADLIIPLSGVGCQPLAPI